MIFNFKLWIIPIVVTVITALLKCEGNYMSWEKRPIPENAGLGAKCLLITEDGKGYTGSSISTEESDWEPDFRKAVSMNTSIIYETTDDWITRRSVYRGSGEIEALFKTEKNAYLAQNTRYSKEDLLESSHFIRWSDGQWKEVSQLDQESVKVWGSRGPWLLAAGRLRDGSGTISLSISSDGALNWQHVDLGGYNPLANARDPSLYLTADGLLFRTTGTWLERFDLKNAHGIGLWERLRDLPLNFNPLAIAGWGKHIVVFGSLPNEKFGLIDAFDRTNSVTVGREIPENFLLTTFSMRENRWYLVGAVEIKSGTETIGFDNMILVSENQGGFWRNTNYPLMGSLEGFDFGSNGRIWAVAAGNRMQVLPPAP
jgi:hypothetical protein